MLSAVKIFGDFPDEPVGTNHSTGIRVLVDGEYHDANNTDHDILHYVGMTIWLAGNWQRAR